MDLMELIRRGKAMTQSFAWKAATWTCAATAVAACYAGRDNIDFRGMVLYFVCPAILLYLILRLANWILDDIIKHKKRREP